MCVVSYTWLQRLPALSGTFPANTLLPVKVPVFGMKDIENSTV